MYTLLAFPNYCYEANKVYTVIEKANRKFFNYFQQRMQNILKWNWSSEKLSSETASSNLIFELSLNDNLQLT